MAYAQIHTQALRHPKIAALSDRAFRLWTASLCYCQEQLTDGAVTRQALVLLDARASAKRYAEELVAATLWEEREHGWIVHDYLDWNASRDVVLDRKWHGVRKAALARDRELRHAIRARDGDRCRYCGGAVVWTDRKGPRGGTYDHVDPAGPNTAQNIVVACRECNGRKGTTRGWALQPLQPGSDLDPVSKTDPEIIYTDTIRYDPIRSEDQTPEHTHTARARGPAGPTAPTGHRRHHRSHAFCGRSCVPGFVHDEFRRKLPGDPDANGLVLIDWYLATSATWADKPIGDDDVVFWRARFSEWQGTTRTPAKAPDAVDAWVAKMAAKSAKALP